MIRRLDATDLRMATVATNYYIHAHRLSKRPVPDAAYRLADHLEQCMSVTGPDPVVPQERWVTTAEAARITGYSDRHIRRLAPLIGRKIGRTWAIRADALPDDEETT